MKKVLFIPILLLFFFSCSPDEETLVPTNTVKYILTVTAGDGGSITNGGTFDEGTEVTITATPNPGYEFVGWEGSTTASEILTITLDSN